MDEGELAYIGTFFLMILWESCKTDVSGKKCKNKDLISNVGHNLEVIHLEVQVISYFNNNSLQATSLCQ